MDPKNILHSISLALLFVPFLIFAGCTAETSEDTGKIVFNTTIPGTLTVELISKIPPKVLVPPNIEKITKIKVPLIFVAKILNYGSYEAPGYICLEGLSNWYPFYITNGSIYEGKNCANFKIKQKDVVEGKIIPGIDVVQIPNPLVAYSPPEIAGTTRKEIIIKYCYNYTTKIKFTLCANVRSFINVTCEEPNPKITEGPLKLINFYTAPSYIERDDSGTEWIVVQLYAELEKDVKDAIIYNPSKLDEICTTPEIKDIGRINTKIMVGLFMNKKYKDNFRYKCSNLTVDPVTGNGKIFCVLRFKKDFLEKIIPGDIYTDAAQIVMNYSVLIRKVRYMELAPLIR